MRTALAICLVTAALLAGCTGSTPSGTTASSASASASSSGTATSETTHTTAPGSSGPATSSPPTSSLPSHSGGPNTAPTIDSFTSARPNATEFTIRFSFAGSDADSDPLSWTLDADGDGEAENSGTTLPGSANFTYAAVGNYTALLTVTDGKAPTNATLRVAVTAPAAPPGLPPLTITGTTKASGNPAMCEPVSPPCGGALSCGGFASGQNEVDCVFEAFDAKYAGSNYVLSGGSQPAVDFWDSCDAASGKYVAEGNYEAGHFKGTVPAGAGCAILWDYSPQPTGATLTLKIG